VALEQADLLGAALAQSPGAAAPIPGRIERRSRLMLHYASGG